MNSPLTLTAQIGFLLFTVIFYFLLHREITRAINHLRWDERKKSKTKFIAVLIPVAIGLFVTIWSLSGIMSDFSKFPLNFLPVILLPLITAIAITFSSGFSQILKQVDHATIVRLQVFRFFVEILLWMLYVDEMLPLQMTFEGRNFDIIAGITAPVIAWLMSRQKLSRSLILIWNILSLGLLINIVTIAILSAPSPIRVFMEEPANTIVAYFPVSLLPGLLVPLAYTLHFFSLRYLAITRKDQVPAL